MIEKLSNDDKINTKKVNCELMIMITQLTGDCSPYCDDL